MINFEKPHSITDSNGGFDWEKAVAWNNKILDSLVGCSIPDFNVKTIYGIPLSKKEVSGKVIILNFWFEGCAPCVAEMPALNKLVEEYKDKDVVFIGFSTDDSKSIINFIKTRPFNYQLVSSDYEVNERFCMFLAGCPANMVFDKKGVLRQIFTGGTIDAEFAKTESYDKLKPTIDSCLNEK